MMITRSAMLLISIGTWSLLSASSVRAQSAPSTLPPPMGSSATPGGAQAKAPAVATSSSTVAEPNVADLYPIEKMHLRDPFIKSGGGGGGGYGGESETSDVNIHNLVLKGVLEGRTGDIALFVDPGSGSNLFLKKGILYNSRNETIPGISGVIKAKQKTVHLITSEKDVQTFILGEQGGPDK